MSSDAKIEAQSNSETENNLKPKKSETTTNDARTDDGISSSVQLFISFMSQNSPNSANPHENNLHPTNLHPTKMIDVGEKVVTRREATATGTLRLKTATARLVSTATLPKGNALETARVAAIMAAKNTPQIIPLCHPLLLSGVDCDFHCDLEQGVITATATVRCSGQTGVEMEALTAVSAALLTIYDMTKGVDDTLEIEKIVLLKKSGGKSGDFLRP